MKKFLTLAAGALVLASGVHAATVTTADSISLTTTNWSAPLSLNFFDSSLGTLTSVKFTYGGGVSTTFRAESLDSAPATVQLNSSANISFGTPLLRNLSVSNSQTQTVSAFDGTIDFGGTSGFGPLVVAGSDSDMVVFTSGLGTFIGTGQFNLLVTAVGQSGASGAGNLVGQINTQAEANVLVEYTFEEEPPVVVPEPGALALVGIALAGLSLTRRKTAKA